MDERIDDILARLAALEARLDRLEGAGAPRCTFLEEEKRIVDTIVRLTSETVVRELDARMEAHGPPPPPPPHHGRR